MAPGIDTFLARYDPEIARQARAARRRLRTQFPGAHELVYDNYNALVFGYSPTARASDAICSIALYPRWVTLFFLRGAELDDPEGILVGSGSTVRSVRLEDETSLDRPAVLALISAARAATRAPFSTRKAVVTVLQAVSARRRRRAPGPKRHAR